MSTSERSISCLVPSDDLAAMNGRSKILHEQNPTKTEVDFQNLGRDPVSLPVDIMDADFLPFGLNHVHTLKDELLSCA
jgi:hypothetical protein